MTNTNEFWRLEGQKAKSNSGRPDSDRGGIVIIAPSKLKPNGTVLVEDDQTVSGVVIESSGVDGVQPGVAYTFGLSDAAKKGLGKSHLETGASTVALLGVKIINGKFECRHARVIGEGRMAPIPKKEIVNGIEVPNRIVEPITVFAKVGKTTKAFQAHLASTEQIQALETALENVGKGVLIKDDATNEERKAARMSSPVSVMAVMYNPTRASLLGLKRNENDTRTGEEIIASNLETLKERTLKRRTVKFAFRAFLVGAEGEPSYDPAHVAFHRAKFDPEKGYTVANQDIADLAEEAEKLGMTLRVEAIPYTTLNASPLTDGTYPAPAIQIAKRQLGLATGQDDISVDYRTLTRHAGFGPAMVVSTVVTDKNTGELRPSVLLGEPERLDGGYSSLKQMATGNFDGSKVQMVAAHSRAEEEESSAGAHQEPSVPAAKPGVGAETDDEFDAEHQPSL